MCPLNSRNHVKGHPRSRDASSPLSPGALVDGLPGNLSSLPLQKSGTLTGTTTAPVPLLSLCPKDTPPQATYPSGYLNEAARNRWVYLPHKNAFSILLNVLYIRKITIWKMRLLNYHVFEIGKVIREA